METDIRNYIQPSYEHLKAEFDPIYQQLYAKLQQPSQPQLLNILEPNNPYNLKMYPLPQMIQ